MRRRRLRGRVVAFALTAPVLAGCAGADGDAQPRVPKVEGQSASPDASLPLGASAPDGKYDASYVLESANVPGARDGTRASSTYAFTFDDCSDTKCWGTVKAPAEGTYEWDGTELVVTFDQMKKTEHCVDDKGQPLEQATIDSTTEHEARLTAAEEGDAAPMKLEGSYEQSTVFDNSRNGCDKAGPDRQQAKFSLVLQRQ